jgi:transcriptional regulator with GAF, ATPase, and Fis domain
MAARVIFSKERIPMFTPQFRTLCDELIKTGREKLAMSMGIVSHIESERYQIIAVSSLTGVFVAGEDFALKDTYCRDVFEQQKTIALTKLEGIQGLQLHPLYETLPLEAYISAPIFVDDKIWGTINFSCMKLRENEFSSQDIEFIETAAKKISAEMSCGI